MDDTPRRATWRAAIANEIARLDTVLKQQTVEAYCEVRLLGQAYDTPDFWARPDVCARSTFNKWKRYDPAFTDVLNTAWEIAKGYRSQAAADAIVEAVDLLQLHTPDLVGTILDLAAQREDLYVALQAAFGGLDRASELTGPKGPPAAVDQRSLQQTLVQIYGLPEEAAAENGAENADSDEEGPDDA